MIIIIPELLLSIGFVIYVIAMVLGVSALLLFLYKEDKKKFYIVLLVVYWTGVIITFASALGLLQFMVG